MPEDIRLAKGEDLDALEDIVNNHIGSDETHVPVTSKIGTVRLMWLCLKQKGI